MKKIIAQIAENFIKKILENISSGKRLEEIVFSCESEYVTV